MAEGLRQKIFEGRRNGVAPSASPSRGPRRRLLLIGAILLLAAVVPAAAVITSFDSACAACHTSQATSVAASAHASTACYSCHLSSAWAFIEQKSDEWGRMYPAAVRGVTLDGPGRRVTRAACARCHNDGPPDLLETGGLRIDHEACASGPEPCDSCHGTVAHGDAVRWARRPVMDECLACHQSSDVSADCDTCHVGKLEGERLTSGPWQVTHGPQWEKTHGMGDLTTCISCHETQKCVRCHATPIPHEPDFMGRHGKEALDKRAKCTRCHQTSNWCTSCHGIAMPHPKGFLKEHSGVAKNRTDERCLRCHAPDDCVNCHVAHTHPGATDGPTGVNAGGE